MATQLKNVKFGQAVLCSISTTDLAGFDLSGTVLCGGTFKQGTINGGTICGGTFQYGTISGGTILGTINNSATICGGTFKDGTISGGTILGTINNSAAICGGTFQDGTINGGSVTTDSFAFASNGGTFCGKGGTISDIKISLSGMTFNPQVSGNQLIFVQ